MLPDALSLDAIARELRTANLAMQRQGELPEDVEGVLLYRSTLVRLFEGLIAAIGTTGPTIPDGGDDRFGAIGLRYAGLWGFFPGDGYYEPLPSGDTTFDLLQRTVIARDGQHQLGIVADVRLDVRSLVVLTDSLVSIELEPPSGGIPFAGGVFVGNARAVQRLTVSADRPYNLLVGFSNSARAPDFLSASRFQLRVSTVTITKVAAAGVADPVADVPVVPKSGIKTISQATYGDAVIPTLGWSQKAWVVRNTGASDAEVTVQGRIDAEGTWVADLDVEATGARITIAAGDYAKLESGFPWAEVRLQAAVAQAEAATDVTTLDVQYLGHQPQVR